MPDGSLGTYVRSLVPATPGVVILPLLANRVVLIRHFRHATRQWHLELPRGFGSPNSTPETDARRELLEEIGAEATELIDLGRLHPDTGMDNSSVCLFAAHVTALGPAGVDEGISDLLTVSSQRLADLIRDGEITDGYTIATYARALLRDVLPQPTSLPDSAGA
jgi:ADP-ribose pyrophosphatase